MKRKNLLCLFALFLTLPLASCSPTPTYSTPTSSETVQDVLSKVVYLDDKGNVLQQTEIPENGEIPPYIGKDIEVPTADKDGYYVFSGWNTTYKNNQVIKTPKIEKITYNGFTFGLNESKTGVVLNAFNDPYYQVDDQGNPLADSPVVDFYIPEQYVFAGKKYDVLEVGSVAINGYKIRRIHIGKNLQKFSSTAILTYYSPMIEEFIVDSNNQYLASKDKVLYNKDFSSLIKVPFTYSAYEFAIPDSVVKIEEQAFQLVSNITYVGTSNMSKLEEIGPQAFSGCGIKSIGLPDSLKTIRIRAFWLCPNLLTIRLAKNITTIEPFAFASCENLNTVYIDEGFTTIGESMFENCPLLQAVRYNIADENNPQYTLKTVERFAFHSCPKLNTFPFNEGIETIAESAFMGCQISSELVLPDSLTSLGAYAFSNNSVSKVTLGKNLTILGNSAFGQNDSLKEFVVNSKNTAFSSYDGCIYNKDQSELVLVPTAKSGHLAIKDDTKKIGDYAIFGNKKLISIDIPSSVTEIGSYGINSNYMLSSISFHNGLKKLGDYSLAYNGVLKEIILPDTVDTIGKGIFAYNSSLIKLHLGNVSSFGEDGGTFYTSLDNCISLDFSNITTSNPNGIKFNTTYLTLNMPQDTLTLPSQTTEVVSYAFSGFSNLKTVDYSKATNLKVLNANTFNIYSNTITKVILPASLTSMAKDVLGTCPNLTEIEFAGTKQEWEALVSKSDASWYGSNFSTLKKVKFKDGTTLDLTLKDPNAKE